MKKIVKMKRFYVISFIFSLIAVTAYVISPYISIYRFAKAIEMKDEKAIASHVDFPAVRKSVTKQVKVIVTNELKKNKENVFTILWLMLVSSLVDEIVEYYISSDGLHALIIQENNQFNSNNKKHKQSNKVHNNRLPKEYVQDYNIKKTDLIKNMHFSGLNTFSIEIEAHKDYKPVDMVFKLRGFSWKLTDVNLHPQQILNDYKKSNKQKPVIKK